MTNYKQDILALGEKIESTDQHLVDVDNMLMRLKGDHGELHYKQANGRELCKNNLRQTTDNLSQLLDDVKKEFNVQEDQHIADNITTSNRINALQNQIDNLQLQLIQSKNSNCFTNLFHQIKNHRCGNFLQLIPE